MNRPFASRFPFSIRALPLAFVLALALTLASASIAAADGIIIPHPPPDQPIPWRDVPLAIKYHRVDVTIVDQVATTKVDQVFVNEASYPVEGTYIFPLPEDAAITSFDMWVDGQKLEGKLLGRDEARAIYEDIVRRQRDPALLEYVGRGAFQASIFPIPPGGERRIELTYSQVLPQTGRPGPLSLPAQHREVLLVRDRRGRRHRSPGGQGADPGRSTRRAIPWRSCARGIAAPR